MHLLIYLIAFLFSFAPQHLLAGSRDIDLSLSYEPVIMPEIASIAIVIDQDDILPVEPAIAEVEFLKLPPVTGLAERVDRLVHGIGQDISPKYDHYGHEIRRYMAHIGDLGIYEDETQLIMQIRNVRKAKVIAAYWEDYLEKEMQDIDRIVAHKQGASLSMLTAFRQNKAMARAFLVSLKVWISANERVLMYLFNHAGMYEMHYPKITIESARERYMFYKHLVGRQAKLRALRTYSPFAMMVY